MSDDSNKTLKTLYLAKRLVFVTIIIYIVGFFVVNSSYLSSDNISRFTYTLKKTLTESYADGTQKNISLMYDDQSVEIVFKDGFAVLSTGTLSVYSSDSVKFSSHSIGFSHPVLISSDRYLLCFDRGGKKLSVYDSFDLIVEKTFDNNILNVSMGSNGYFSVITEAEGYKGFVTVFDENFKEVMRWYSADYYLLYSAFTSRNILSIVSVAANKENTDIHVISVNYKTGEERRSVCAESRFPMDCVVKKNSTLEVITDIDVITLRGEGFNSVYRYGSDDIYTYRQFDEYTAIVSTEDSVKKLYRITVIDSVGNVMFEKIIDGYRDIRFFNGYFYVLGYGKITTLNLEGEDVGLIEVDTDVYRILVSKGFVLLVKPEQIKLIDSSKLFEYRQ